MAPILEVKNISKSFSGNSVLADVSLAVEAGQVHALVGENGAGKVNLDEHHRRPRASRQR